MTRSTIYMHREFLIYYGTNRACLETIQSTRVCILLREDVEICKSHLNTHLLEKLMSAYRMMSEQPGSTACTFTSAHCNYIL